MAKRNYSNTAVATTLSSGINGVVTSLVVADPTGYPAAPFTIIIDEGLGAEEIILVGAKSGANFTSLTRGYGGTSAQSHSGGAAIKHVAVGSDLDLIWQHIHKPATDDTVQLSHDDLSGVSANDHHNQQHAINGADHTGSLDHGSLTGLGDDDHPQYATDTDLTNHGAAADPHTGYLKKKSGSPSASDLVLHTHADNNQGGPISGAVVYGYHAESDAGGSGGIVYGSTPKDMVTGITIVIPSTWSGYTLDMEAFWYVFSGGGGGSFQHRFELDGVNQTLYTFFGTNNEQPAYYMMERLTGQTTTGTRTVDLEGLGHGDAGATMRILRVKLTAIRTS